MLPYHPGKGGPPKLWGPLRLRGCCGHLAGGPAMGSSRAPDAGTGEWGRGGLHSSLPSSNLRREGFAQRTCVGRTRACVCVQMHTCAHEHTWRRQGLWSTCKRPHTHRGGDKGRDLCHRSPVVKEFGRLTPQPQASPPDSPQVRRMVSPGLENPPGTPAGEGLSCPLGARRDTGGAAAGTRGCGIPWTCGGGGGSGLQPRLLREPMQAHSTMGTAGRSPHARWRHLCALRDMQGRTQGPGSLWGGGLGRRCPSWEVTRAAGRGEGLTAPDVG